MRSSLAGAFVMFAATAAVAASEGGGHGAHHAPAISDLLWPVVNFALFLGLLYRFVWPMIKTSVAERRQLIETEISEADRAERESRAGLAEIEALRASEQQEGERIVRELREEAARERTALLEAARRAAERFREDARRLGEQEAARSAHEIRHAVAAHAVSRAAQILRERIGEEDQRRFLGDFLSGVQREASR